MKPNPFNDSLNRDLLAAFAAAPPAGPCPPETIWIALLSGELEAPATEALRGHLARCAACVETATDARLFLDSVAPPRAHRSPAARFRVAGAIAAGLIALVASVLLLQRAPPSPERALAELVAALDVPAPAIGPFDAGDSELAYRGGEPGAADRSLASAVLPYRERRWGDACSALAEHGRQFPRQREARYLGAVACLKAGETARAEAMLASLAAVSGERREEARALLERLQRARGR
ncbi:MAG: hypothetical protein AAB011_03770 [Candidatus Eisenbacteria bacterium]